LSSVGFKFTFFFFFSFLLKVRNLIHKLKENATSFAKTTTKQVGMSSNQTERKSKTKNTNFLTNQTKGFEEEPQESIMREREAYVRIFLRLGFTRET
jgi:hypothetical protein